jgi:hypothetical protein
MRIDSDGRLLVGTSTSAGNYYGTSSHASLIQASVFGSGTTNSYLAQSWTANPGTNREHGVHLAFARSRGTTSGSYTSVSPEDKLTVLSFQGADGSGFVEGARIEARVDGTPGTNVMPGRLVFSTTADGASSPTERMRITSSGQLRHIGAGTVGSPAVSFSGSAPSNSLVVDESGKIISETAGTIDSDRFSTANRIAYFRTSLNAGNQFGQIAIKGFHGAGINFLRGGTGAETNSAGIFSDVSDNLRFTTGGATERARLDSSGRLLVGTSSTSATGTIFAQGSSSSTTGPSYLYLQRGQAAGASIGNGTSIGIINFADNASGVFAQIAAEGDAPSSSGDYPGRLLFSTTADGASSPTERMRITSDAYIRLASGTGGIQFNGDTAAANALDDYEEGTVPSTNLVSTDFTASSGITTGGLYRKVGTLVFVTIFIRPVNFGEYPIGSTIQYTLPFAVSNSAIFVGSGYVGATTMSGTNYILSNVSLISSTLTAYVKQESLSTITAKNIWISAVYTTS